MNNLKEKAIKLRKRGKTYSEIQKIIGKRIAKSTFSYWLRDVQLTERQKERINGLISMNLKKGREKSLAVRKKKRGDFLKLIGSRNRNLSQLLKNKDIARIALAILYLGEGAKNYNRGYLCFANSDPLIIELFLSLMRKCYNINETKFRCTLQCRADQKIKQLEKFWSKITKIPPSQFYKARVDPRTIGKPSKNLDYKGVCRIDYFSADIFNELTVIGKLLCTVDINNFKNANY